MNRFKTAVAALALGALFAAMAYTANAEDKKPQPAQTTAQYLEQLQVKLDHAAQRANQPAAEGSSVVGLRGSKQESASKQLYWKGKKGSKPVTPEEVKEFRAAVEQARAGKTAEALTALKAFQIKYPDSALNPDVTETIARLNPTPNP